jgi:formamidopyrimidine-DNA glycosylase
MDQSIIAGLGNIYVDESLFEARIHPAAVSSRLSEKRLRILYLAVQKVLRRAIQAGGSSIRDYSGVDGKRGYFQIRHRVYRKTGQPCPRCKTKIKRTIIGQRSTHFCPRCQKK